jgi:hypothetical protein
MNPEYLHVSQTTTAMTPDDLRARFETWCLHEYQWIAPSTKDIAMWPAYQAGHAAAVAETIERCARVCLEGNLGLDDCCDCTLGRCAERIRAMTADSMGREP